jgi:putative ABC transport system substrate-binding protein
MKRRRLLAGAGSWATATAGFAASAQRPAMPRVGFLIAGDPEPMWTLFRTAMADLGYAEDRTVKYEYRPSDSDRAQLAAKAASLIELNVDVIVAVLTPAIAAAKQATSRIPIVFNGGAPETGFVTNFARPEGNLTGVWGQTSVLAGKSVQVFHDIKPTTKALGALLNASDPFHIPLRREIEAAARAHNIEIVALLLKGGGELATAYEELARRGVDGVLIQPTLGIETAATLAVKNRMAAISYRREFAVAGGLLSLGADQPELGRMLASYVDKVLKGAKTADLPVNQASKFEMVVNRKTAMLLGITLSPMFLALADEVIE